MRLAQCVRAQHSVTSTALYALLVAAPPSPPPSPPPLMLPLLLTLLLMLANAAQSDAQLWQWLLRK